MTQAAVTPLCALGLPRSIDAACLTAKLATADDADGYSQQPAVVSTWTPFSSHTCAPANEQGAAREGDSCPIEVIRISTT